MKRYMKKITKYCSSLFVCVLLLSQTSCDSFLDRQEDSYRMTLMISNILRGAGQLMK